MKKNLILQGIVALGLLLGTAFAAQAAETQPLADTSGSMVSAPLDESTTDAVADDCEKDSMACIENCMRFRPSGTSEAEWRDKCTTNCIHWYCS